MTPDFSFAVSNFDRVYKKRTRDQGAVYYEAIGVAREATEDRRTASRYSLEFNESIALHR